MTTCYAIFPIKAWELSPFRDYLKRLYIYIVYSKALFIPDFIICSGYFLSIKVVVSSFKRVSSVDLFEIIVQSLRAKEKGMLIVLCFGWHILIRICGFIIYVC